MSWYITKTSVLSSAVPTDGVMYYISKDHWANTPDNKKLFSTREDALEEIQVPRIGGLYLPNGVQIVEE